MVELIGFSFPVLYIHLGTLGCLVLLIGFADHQAFSWMMGHTEKLNAGVLKTVHYLTGLGLLIMILSGAYMAFPMLDALLKNPAFLVKMAFVAALVINSFFIGSLMHLAVERSFASLSSDEKRPLFISGVVSSLSWAGAFISALFMGFKEIETLLHSIL